MFKTSGLRIPPVVGGILGIALMALGISAGLGSLAIAGAVVALAASARVLIWR